MRGLYLLHFEYPFKHAAHYLGYAHDVEKRIAEHVKGKGANLTKVVTAAGIEVWPVRLWPGGTRNMERQMKNNGTMKQHCPLCKDEFNARKTVRRKNWRKK